MALLPLLLEDPLYFYRPPRVGLYDELSPIVSFNRCPYIRHWRTLSSQADAGSTVQIDKDKFQANLDVQQFKPEEVTVKVTGENEITVEGKHEEKKDEHGYISRQFVRRYVLPKGCNIDKIESKLSSDGVLTITAPRVDQKQIEHREVPITQTGQPSKPIQEKKEEKKEEKKKK